MKNLTFPLENWVRHESRDAFWQWGSVIEHPGSIECPLLAIGGWSDRYSNSVMNLMTTMGDRAWGIVGPWGHHYPDQAHPGPAVSFQAEALRWWDHHLKGEDNGYDDIPRLRVWESGYDSPTDVIDHRNGCWTTSASWPSDSVSNIVLNLGPGLLEPDENATNDTSIIQANRLVGLGGGDTGYFGRFGGLPLDQSQDDEASAVFETTPLEAHLHVLGKAVLTLSLPNSDSAGVIVARIVDVPPSGPPCPRRVRNSEPRTLQRQEGSLEE